MLERTPQAHNGPFESRMITRWDADAAPVPSATDYAYMRGNGHLTLVVVDPSRFDILKAHLVAPIPVSQNLVVLAQSEISAGVLQAPAPDCAYLEKPANRRALASNVQRVIHEAEVLTREIKSYVDNIESKIQMLQNEIVEAHRQFDLVMMKLGYDRPVNSLGESIQHL